MENAQITVRIRKKRFLIDAFLHTCSQARRDDPDSALKNAVTSHFLQAVILELIIKALYELDAKEEAPFTHNLSNLFGTLEQETKDEVAKRFNEARERQKDIFDRSGIQDVAFHPLEDVLSNNATTIRDFKYDAVGVPSNSSADRTFYSDLFTYIDRRVAEIGA